MGPYKYNWDDNILGPYWGIPIWGNYHIDLSGSRLQLLILEEFDPIGFRAFATCMAARV